MKLVAEPAGRFSGVAGGWDIRNPAPVIVIEETVSCCELLFCKTNVHVAVWPSTMLPKLTEPVVSGPVHGAAAVSVAEATEVAVRITCTT